MAKYISDADLDSVSHLSSRAAAKVLGCGKSTINDARARRRASADQHETETIPEAKKPKILLLDLETSPLLASIWSLWGVNVGLNQLLESGEVICFGARWLGDKEVEFRSVHHDSKEVMLQRVWTLLNEADAMMGWNSKGFDMKHLNREFLEAGMVPPSPVAHLDLMLESRKLFKFPSQKLDYVAQTLGVGAKVTHEGHTLWLKCLAGDEEAWERMREYQIQDVQILEGVYLKMLPWLEKHPNMGLFSGESEACPNCGSTNLRESGEAVTSASVFKRYVCNKCGKWSRSAVRSSTTGLRSWH